jgi:hypothetical protein
MATIVRQEISQIDSSQADGEETSIRQLVDGDRMEFQRFMIDDLSKIAGMGNIQPSFDLEQVNCKTALLLPVGRRKFSARQ